MQKKITNGFIMKKFLMIGLVLSCIPLVACDQFKTKKEDPNQSVASEWSCTSEDNLKDLQLYLKQEYLKQIDKSLRQSDYYQADQALLKKINDNLKFSIKEIRTLTKDPKESNALECEGQIVVNFPKGLLKRAENAYLEQPHEGECHECDGGSNRTLIDYLEDREVPLTIQDDLVKAKFYFDVIKTDKEGYALTVQQQSAVIQAVVFITQNAVQYESYVKENKQLQKYSEQSEEHQAAQYDLAKKAMDIRNKELDSDKLKVVERLNLTWDNFSDEQRAQLKQDQAEWFEKRDIDCKVISQKSIHNLSDAERETYQNQYNYWDDALTNQNTAMQYTKCFIQKTNERIVYLNNVFN